MLSPRGVQNKDLGPVVSRFIHICFTDMNPALGIFFSRLSQPKIPELSHLL